MNMRTLKPLKPFKYQAGYNLVELMIASFLGVLISAGAMSMFSTSNANFQRLGSEVLQINNGMFVTGLLQREVQLAGYMGHLVEFNGAPYPLDVCSADLGVLTQAVQHPIYGFDSPAASPIGCLDNDNFLPNTDILVLRRASTRELRDGDQPLDGGIYIQANTDTYAIQFGKNGSFIAPKLNANNDVGVVGTRADGGVPAILKVANVPNAAPAISTSRLAADIREFKTEIFFVSPCTIPADEGDVCTGSLDDGGFPEPSLKRLSGGVSNGALQWTVEVLAEGVENLQIQYGIDQSEEETLGSGVPDVYVSSPTNAQWPNVMNINVSILLKNTVQGSFLNQDVYNLGDGVAVGPFNDNFSRKVYQSNFRLVNVSMRREVPEP